MTKLRACPFCGAKPEVRQIDRPRSADHGSWYAFCSGTNCQISLVTEPFGSEAEAIAVWNTRAVVRDITIFTGDPDT